jgi:hypothetical protein
VSDGVAKFRMKDGTKMYVPIVGGFGGSKQYYTNLGFATRTQAWEYGLKVSKRYYMLLMALSSARKESLRFRLRYALANFLSNLATKALNGVNRWHPK